MTITSALSNKTSPELLVTNYSPVWCSNNIISFDESTAADINAGCKTSTSVISVILSEVKGSNSRSWKIYLCDDTHKQMYSSKCFTAWTFLNN